METSPSVTEEQSSHPLLLFDDKIIKPELISTRNSSVESENSKLGNVQRKAYMDLRDAIAMLDETCPNPDPSPSLTPRTPRTPLTPHPRNKRARSKSSDNSSNYSNDRLSEKSSEVGKVQEKNKKRPFLRKIGISITEEHPFLAKLAPKIIGKPYLEKIGPSKAVEKPFLDKIGSSKTLDKFTFELPRKEALSEKKVEEVDMLETNHKQEEAKGFARRSGKGFLLKMYSFETEDLDDSSKKKYSRDPLRGASLNDVLDKGSNSLPSMENVERGKAQQAYPIEIVKCKVTMSEEVLSSSTCLSSSVEGPMWENSPRRKRRTKKFLAESIRNDTSSSKEGQRSDDSVPNSPSKRRHLIDVEGVKVSPAKNRRQTSDDVLDKPSDKREDVLRCGGSSDNLFASKKLNLATVNDSKSQINQTLSPNISKETFQQLYNKFESQEVPTESYAAFKHRTRKNQYPTSALRRMTAVQPSSATSLNIYTSSSPSSEMRSGDQEPSVNLKPQFPTRTKSVLRKQDGVDHTSDQEYDNATTSSRLDIKKTVKKRIVHEPSQETVDLLTELRRVKSLLKTPSFEKELDFDESKTALKQPKKILLTDKEFCLSIERENSIRRTSAKEIKSEIKDIKSVTSPQSISILGPAFFEKQCLSLDYADDDKSHKSDIHADSRSSIKCRLSEFEELSKSTPIGDIKSCASNMVTSPSDDQPNIERKQEEYSDVDFSIPVDERGYGPKFHLHNQSKPSDQYEIMSPRVTPFKVKKRLGKISVEEAIHQESFALNKTNCGSIAVQKKTKCFPL